MSVDDGLRSIFSDVRGDEVSSRELASLLSQGDSSGPWNPESTTVIYQGDVDTGFHGIFKKDQMVDLRVRQGVADSVVYRLRRQVEAALIDSPGDAIASQILFSDSCRVRGWWRFSDQFQLGPAPEKAPVADFEMAKHPFLLQFRYRQSTNSIVDSVRKSHIARELELLLNSLLNFPVELANRSSERHWVWPANAIESGNPVISEYLQSGYVFPEFPQSSDSLDFPDDAVALAEQDSKLYYGQYFPAGLGVGIPIDLSDTLKGFYGLGVGDRAKFLRASYWYQLAYRMFHTSQTAGFLALINAVEALVVQPKGGDQCPACRKQIEGPTERFRAFLEKFAPMPGDDADRVRKGLYGLRSNMTHGDLVFDTDSGGFSWGSSPLASNQRHQYRMATIIVEVALNNWLRDVQPKAVQN